MIRPLQGTLLAALSLGVALPVSAGGGPPTFQSSGDKPTLQILSIDQDTFETEDLVTHENWSTGWSFVRPFGYGNSASRS